MIFSKQQLVQEEEANWNFAVTLPDRGDEIDKTTVKGSQFQKPYLEFSHLAKTLRGFYGSNDMNIKPFSYLRVKNMVGFP